MVRVVFRLRKLCIAVLLFSFIGFGPLETLFHKNLKTDGNDTTDKSVFQMLKESADSLQLSSKSPQIETFLITEDELNQGSSKMNMAMIISRDSTNNKISYGTVPVPPLNNEVDFKQLKETVEKNHHIPIDHCFIINSSGAAKILDLLLPNGITYPVASANGNAVENMKGKDIIALIDKLRETPNSDEELMGIISVIKNEMGKNSSKSLWISLIPSLIKEARHSVKTDVAKGELVELGLSAMINPITKFEPLRINENPSKAVNLDIEDIHQKSMVN